MDRQRWLQVKELFDATIGLSAAERRSILADRCSADPALYDELSSLLDADDSSQFWEPTSEVSFQMVSRFIAFTGSRERIGCYRLVRLLGEGGMGVVYEGSREQPFHQRVAVKLLKLGAAVPSLIRNFDREREILAALEHPGITRILDGGSEDGCPYLVMEYVDGVPVTEYANVHNLSVRARLELFRTICSAVEYAHRNLVVHRDIKPGNILVTADGTAKLLDFGIARILDPAFRGYAPQSTIHLLTPEFASPEQVKGEPITTATDVYSLGVLLYHLLTGRPPYVVASNSAGDLAAAICETIPPRPSGVEYFSQQQSDLAAKTRGTTLQKLRHTLSGDLDNIVLKALRKDPQRRYGSVAQFSDDVGRYLLGMPVLARRDTFSYRLSKFVGRNRAAALAASLLLVTIAAALVTTTWQARIARAERDRANLRFEQTRRIANSILFELHDSIRDLPGSTKARELIARRAVELLDSLAKDSGHDNALRLELAEGYRRLALVQGVGLNANLGQTAGALESLRKAKNLAESVVRDWPANTQAERELAAIYTELQHVHLSRGNRPNALKYNQLAIEMDRRLLAQNAQDIRNRKSLALDLQRRGGMKGDAGDLPGALEDAKTVLSLYSAIGSEGHQTRSDLQNLSLAHKRLGAIYAVERKWEPALLNYRAALQIDQNLLGRDPSNNSDRFNITFSYSDIGWIYGSQGAYAAALNYYGKALAIRRGLLRADPNDERAHNGVARTLAYIGEIQLKRGVWEQALAALSEALTLRTTGPATDTPEFFLATANLYRSLGDCQLQLASRSGMPAKRKREMLLAAKQEYVSGEQAFSHLKTAPANDESGENWQASFTRRLRAVEEKLR